MSALSPWTLAQLLPLVEEEVSASLPVSLSVKPGEEEGPGLIWEGARVAGLSLSGFLPGEERRWGPCAVALAQEVFGRLMRERTISGLPGPYFLTRALKTGPKKGLLLKAKRPPWRENIFALSQGLFFLELERPKALLKQLWQEGHSFLAASYLVETEEDLHQAPSFLSLAEDFGFVWFTGRAARYFSELGLREEVWKPLKRLKSLARRHFLLWARGKRESLSCLEGQAAFSLGLTEESALFALSPEKEPSFLLESLELGGGLLPPEGAKRPLCALWAAFEHARRLGEGALVEFEPFSWHVLGDVFLDLGDVFAACQAFERGREGTRQPIELLNSLAVVYVELDDLARAEAALREALALAPEDPMLYYNLALFLDRQGRPEALSLFEQAFSLSSEPPFAEALAERLAAQGAWPRVKEILTRAEGKLSPTGLFLLARAHYEEGRFEEAFSLFRELLKEKPDHLEALGFLALLYIQLKGEYSVAEAVLPRLEGEPGLAPLAQNLKALMEVQA